MRCKADVPKSDNDNVVAFGNLVAIFMNLLAYVWLNGSTLNHLAVVHLVDELGRPILRQPLKYRFGTLGVKKTR